MNQHEASEMYEEARQLVAENRHADALSLFDQLVEAFPENAEINRARAKAFDAFERVDRSEENDLGEVSEVDQLNFAASPDESASVFVRIATIAMVGVGAVSVAAYFAVFAGSVDPGVESDSPVNQRASTEPIPLAQVPRSAPEKLPGQDNVPAQEELGLAAPEPEQDSESNPPPPTPTTEDAQMSAVPAAKDFDVVQATTDLPERDIETPGEGDAPSAIDPIEDDVEKLIELIQLDRVQAAVDLLRDNRDIANSLDFESRPILTYARSVEMASLLVEAGADYDLATSGGWTPLMWISGRNGSIEVAKYLIKLGAWVSIEDNSGMRPIHQAAFMGNHELVSVFVDHGADINAIDDTNVTPLHGAAWSGDLEGVKRYLALGADLLLQNKGGKTPHDVANERGNTDLLPLLDPVQTAAPSTELAMPATASTGPAGVRTLAFADDTKLGTVQVRDWGSTDYKAWESAGSAWGTVNIPVGKEVMLMIDVSQLESLNAIAPEGIQVLYIRGVKLDDAQLENLYHLTGLRRITLSKTGVSRAAVEALQAALPECTIRN